MTYYVSKWRGNNYLLLAKGYVDQIQRSFYFQFENNIFVD